MVKTHGRLCSSAIFYNISGRISLIITSRERWDANLEIHVIRIGFNTVFSILKLILRETCQLFCHTQLSPIGQLFWHRWVVQYPSQFKREKIVNDQTLFRCYPSKKIIMVYPSNCTTFFAKDTCLSILKYIVTEIFS